MILKINPGHVAVAIVRKMISLKDAKNDDNDARIIIDSKECRQRAKKIVTNKYKIY
jgi:hypothetical protein